MRFPSDRASYPTKGTLNIMIVYQVKQVLQLSKLDERNLEPRKEEETNSFKLWKITQKTVAK